MKNITIKTISLALFIGSTACSDILDKGPLDKFSEKDVWESVELAQNFLYPSQNYATGLLIWNDKWTDNDVIQDDGGASNVNKEQIDRYYDAGWNVYGNIRKCNLMLQKMEENTSFLEQDKKYLIAQAKMQRAMIYFSRARLFGKLMIVDRVIDPEENMEFPRTETIKDTYDFILKDLQEAAVDLPVSVTSSEIGSLTQGAAYALMAEVALHGAAYIELGQEEYYNIAKEASEALFALGQYELDADYEKMFNEFDYALGSKEIILAQFRHENNTNFASTWMQTLVPNVNNDKLKEFAKNPPLNDSFEGWIGMFPSVDLVSDYEVKDIDGTAKDWDQSSFYKNYLQNGGYVSKAIYQNRDNRFYATIVQDSSKFFNSLVTMRDKGNLHWNSKAGGDWGMALTGYVWRKGVYTARPLLNSDPTFYHYVILRLGRSYLNYAEVMLHLGNISTAIEYINKTRTVHGGMPELPMTLSSDEAWKAYKRERRIDLVHEGDRYWSLLRWGKAEGKDTVEELTKTHQSISISEDGKSFEIIALPYQTAFNERIFTKKRYLFPVPEGERINNPSLDQNEGW
ncbi:RagB/SusD family nutrient uptake outer membrane protein [uncultured Parabacteroides sp.]|uniref:RagB/SusD family nutrient uptake outer membrane protein n=1 Tax=uncultured Parabacteroides sp. TaxID=512312 RepID=UPI00280545F5|nr:RagB/SusD family nutrient uptake outer membrane protein [uncultured Parabacteroides sp.]